MELNLRCIICETELSKVFPDTFFTEPNNGLTFIAYGNYGSRVFDPPGSNIRSSFLEIKICDECTKVKIERGLVFNVNKNEHIDYEYEVATNELYDP